MSASREKKQRQASGPSQKDTPAVAVETRLKPARECRWVAAAPLRRFQLPGAFEKGREACDPQRERGIP